MVTTCRLSSIDVDLVLNLTGRGEVLGVVMISTSDESSRFFTLSGRGAMSFACRIAETLALDGRIYGWARNAYHVACSET
jgi:hypothetical protein